MGGLRGGGGGGGGLLLPGCGKESIICDAKANECMSGA